MVRRALAVVFVAGLSTALVACAGSQAVRRPDTVHASLWRWVPPGTNALAWIDMARFRRSTLQDLVDNDVQAVQALMDEVGSADDQSTTRQLLPRLLDAWRKLDAVLLATRSSSPAPPPPPGTEPGAFTPTPPASEDRDSVFLFLARWTDADLEAIARLANEPPAPAPTPPAQPATIAPPVPDPLSPAPGPTGAAPLQSPAVMPPGTSPPVGDAPYDGPQVFGASPLATPTPPPEPMVRAVVGGKRGWIWGSSALVPVGAGVWVLANKSVVERLTSQPSRGAYEHPELPVMARDLGLFEQTFAYVGRADAVTRAEELLPSTGLNERAPWPEVIQTGDWFGVGVDADADVRLALFVAPGSAGGVNAAETRMRAWRERFARSGFSYFLYLHEAFEQARVQAVHERVELEVVIDEERASLAYARISGMGIVVGAIAAVFLSAFGSGLSALSALGS